MRTFLESTWGILNTDHTPGLSDFKRIEIMYMCCDHNGLKFRIIDRTNFGKFINIYELIYFKITEEPKQGK